MTASNPQAPVASQSRSNSVPTSKPVTETADNMAKIERIRKVIRDDGNRWRQRFPILANNNVMGFTIWALSLTGIAVLAFGYIEGVISAWLVIPLVAILTSFLHELEHDLIHWQYFKNTKWMHNLMLLGVWVARPGTINPWIRRRLHFLHHKVSGSEGDLEERGIGNGHNYGLMRFWIMMDTYTGNLIRAYKNLPAGHRAKALIRITISNLPFGVITALTWYGFIGFHLITGLAALAGMPISWSSETLAFMDSVSTWVVVLVAPFYLRSFCLNFISSNMHYYGDVTSLMEQTQVLNAPRFWPFQLFCFNFGSTHGIHHFVVGEPFYIRQLTAKAAHKVMAEEGIRFNDLGTFSRTNRFQESEENVVSAAA